MKIHKDFDGRKWRLRRGLTSGIAKFHAVSVSGVDYPPNELCGSRQDSGTLRAVLVLIGFTAVIAQIVLMRELMAVFYGNEMSLGLMLASWLIWTAAGSAAFGRLAVRAVQPRQLMAFLEVILAVVFPLAIFLTRASKLVFQTVPGEMLGPGAMILASLAVLSGFCLVSGGLFAVGSQVYARMKHASNSTGTSQVYLLEAVGSGLGGLAASLVLVRFFQAFESAALVSLLNLLAAASLLVRSSWRRRLAYVTLVAIFLSLVFPFGCDWIERKSLALLWRGYHLVATRNSVYGNLAVVQTEDMHTLFENGLVAFNVPDPLAAEEAVHFALLEHPSPKSLLLVGGGVNGSLSQALQHPSLQRVDYVELDATILDLAQKLFPAEWAPLQGDPRVRVHTMDGRFYLKSTNQKFDAVIVNLPDPQTAQLNRFYTREFFQEVAEKLTDDGVFSFQLRGAEDYIGPELAEFLRCIHKTLREVFPEVVVIPGDPVHFFASKQAGALTLDSGELIARIRDRRLHTTYLREYYLPYRMSADRMVDLETQLQARASTRVNRDFAPAAYYFDVALWGMRFNLAYRRAFHTMEQVRFGRLLASLGLALVVIAAFVFWRPNKQDRMRFGACFGVAATGFTIIGLEILLLLAFQAMYGYVYQQLAIIVAGFMMGAALGSWWSLRGVENSAVQSIRMQDAAKLVWLQFLAAVSPLLLYLLLQVLAAITHPAAVFVVSQGFFPLLAVVCGLLAGCQFPVASRIFFSVSKDEASSPGTLYALDLAGACVGALILSSYLIPVFGFRQTAWLMGVLNLAPAALLGLLTWKMRVRSVS